MQKSKSILQEYLDLIMGFGSDTPITKIALTHLAQYEVEVMCGDDMGWNLSMNHANMLC